MKKLPTQINWVNISEAAEGNEAAGSPGGADVSAKLLRNIRGIILDFDGTLFDNALIPFYLIGSCPTDMLRIWRERLVRRRFTGRDYTSPELYYRIFFTALGKACRRSSLKMRNWYFNRYMPRMIRVLKKHYKLRPGALEILQRFEILAAKAENSSLITVPRVAIYSDYPFLRERLEALGFSPGPAFRLYGPESFGAQKPAARPFLRIARDLGVSPEETLVIGDREETDGIGAFKAGMRFFCLETGRRRYYRLDPYRRAPEKGDRHGPSLLMYAGAWEDLKKMLKKEWGNKGAERGFNFVSSKK